MMRSGIRVVEGPTSVSISLFPIKGNPLGSSWSPIKRKVVDARCRLTKIKAEKDRVGRGHHVKIFFTSIHSLWSSADHLWRALPPPRDITYRSLENQHEDFRGSRWTEQLDGDLPAGRPFVYLGPFWTSATTRGTISRSLVGAWRSVRSSSSWIITPET